MDYKIGRSVSLYSYQQNIMRKAGFRGLHQGDGKDRKATGIELLAEQMIDSFPVITPNLRRNGSAG